MERLDWDILSTACRALYEMAGENYVLPPLIRDAGKGGARPSQVYSCPCNEAELLFLVSLDEALADRNALARSKLPLKFHAELCDAKTRGAAVEISQDERYELIRAFLLGAKLPIGAVKKNDAPGYNLSIQLSSTFFVDCGELNGDFDGRSAADICDEVAQKIYERSTDFFADEQQGLAVWSLQAARSLFGEAIPSPKTFWPNDPDEANDPDEPVAVVPSVADASVRAGYRHSAIAAAFLVAIFGFGSLAIPFTLFGRARTPSEAAENFAKIRLASLQPERRAGTSSEAPAVTKPFSDPTSTAPPRILNETHVDASGGQISRASSVPAPIPIIQTASLSQDPASRDDERATLVAMLFAPASISGSNSPASWLPAAVQSAEPKPKPLPPAKSERHTISRQTALMARSKSHRSSNQPTLPQRALVSLAGMLKSIERIPGQIFGGDKHAKG